MNTSVTPHSRIEAAFKRVDPSGLLAWSILDQKSEKYITVALAAELNRHRRIAFTEYKGIDLVLLDGDWNPNKKPNLVAGYEAKCQLLALFGSNDAKRQWRSDKSRPRANRHWYSGGCLDWDFEKRKRNKNWMGLESKGGLFYIIEVDPTQAQLKYHPPKRSANFRPTTIADALREVERCVGRAAIAKACSRRVFVPEAGAHVQIHLALFDHRKK